MPTTAAADRTVVTLDRLTLAYDETALVDRLDFHAQGPGLVALLGGSGVGKSTLLRAIAGLIRPEGGSIRTSGAVSLMAQDDALLPWADAVGNIVIGARLRGERADQALAQRLLASVDLPALAGRPATWSGGMRKRVALARLLYEDRPLALLDEPFAALDALTRRGVHALASRALKDRLVLLVTHDPLEAITLADRIVVLAGAPAGIALDETPPPRPPGSLRDALDPTLRPLHQRILASLGAAV